MFYIDVAQAAPRSIPWDCSDWQPSPAVADADDPRVSLILESLAANRGKTIYCAIDQSDTFTKAETWAAGRHRNERDDTVYFGESGNFRGFLAAQEGYLTDGESGVTGVSRELIFEFPREERRRRWRTVRFDVPTDGSQLASAYSCSYHPVRYSSDSSAKSTARRYFTGDTGSCPVTTDWAADADAAAQTHCRRRGGRVVAGSVSYDATVLDYQGEHDIWDYEPDGSGAGSAYTVRHLQETRPPPLTPPTAIPKPKSFEGVRGNFYKSSPVVPQQNGQVSPPGNPPPILNS